VLLIAPPTVTKLTELDEMFEGSIEKSVKFAGFYRWRAEWLGVGFFDAGSVVRCSDLDGIHLEAGEHAKLGKALALVIREMLD
jgi:lysophospholipase L1-like esterase